MFDRGDYDYYKAHGICVKCRSADAVNGRILCPACAKRHSITNKKRYAAMPEDQKTEYVRKSIETHNRMTRWRKEQGVCTLCGKSKVRKGLTMCQTCAERMREYKKRSWAAKSADEKAAYRKRVNERRRQKRAERKAQGLCVRCGKNKARDGITLCAACAEYQAKATQRYKKRVEGKNNG